MSNPEMPPWMDEAPWGSDADAPDESPAGPRIVTEEERAADDYATQPHPRVWYSLDRRTIKNRLDENGDPVEVPFNTPGNVENILRVDPRWIGKIRTNDFTGDTEVTLPGDDAPMVLGTVCMIRLRMWIERVYRFVPSETETGAVILSIGDENKYHPVVEWLDSLEWDGRPRLMRMLADYFKAEDNELHSEMARCWMVSAVARVMQPGCKVDTTLILVGAQGARKSTACRVLAGDPARYSDTLLDLNSKDLYEQIHGVWLYELAELDSFKGTQWAKIKAILSSPLDRYRRPYGKGVEPRKRNVVFIGTTNEEEFLGDATGSRRFWPVKVGRVDVEALERDREQLWAEAAMLYKAGTPWWLDDDMAKRLADASSAYTIKDPWDEPITGWVEEHIPDGRQNFTIATVLKEAIGLETEKFTPAAQRRVGAVLRGMGYRKKRRKHNGRFVYVWSTE